MLTLIYQLEKRILKIKGSLPYFSQGHNIYFSQEKFNDTIEYISDVLQLDITRFKVNEFEFGGVVKSSHDFSTIKNNHHSLNKKDKIREHENWKMFVNNLLWLKMYDVNSNVKKKVKKLIRDSLREEGKLIKNINYVKIEMVYKNPEQYFKRQMSVTDLQSPAFHALLLTDLENNYAQLTNPKGDSVLN